MFFEDFVRQVDSVLVQRDCYKLVDSTHPLDVWYGYNSNVKPTLMVTQDSDFDLRQIPTTRCISVHNIKRRDGVRFLAFSCNESEKTEMFQRLGFDLLECSRAEPNGPAALLALIERYRAWCMMLGGRGNELMTELQQKGLSGELLYLEKMFGFYDHATAVYAWRGPNKADQDFIFSDRWAEVKSVKHSASSVEISSLEQLSPTAPGTLAVYKIEKSSEIEPCHFTLFSLVNRIEEVLNGEPSLLEAFREKLSFAGYDYEKGKTVYSLNYWVVREVAEYDVGETFPRLSVTLKNQGIVAARYFIDFAAIEQYRKEN